MKIAIITGGSRGIGKNTALHLAKKGNDVIITYHTQKEEADEVVQSVQKMGRKAAALKLDVAISKSFAEFVEQVRSTLKAHWNRDTFDFLINNAGTGLHAPYMETTEEQFDEMLNVHLKGPFFLTQNLLPWMNDGGRIVNLSSGLARFATPGSAAYGTMKGAMETLTRYMAKELGARGITANIVAPGPIETDFRGGAVRDNPELNKFLAAQTSLGRVGLPDDIGGVIASLLSEDNRWVTAQRIEASGGIFI